MYGVRENIESLSRSLSSKYSLRLTEIHHQTIDEIPAVEFLRRKIFLNRQIKRWSIYKDDLSQKFFEVSTTNSVLKARCSIEAILSGKHVYAWRTLIESNLDLLVVMEDDCHKAPKSDERFLALLESLDSCKSIAPLYVDLAGGFDICAISGGISISPLEQGLVKFAKAMTNTTCAYMINRQAAEFFLSVIRRNPDFINLPADWLLNSIFIELAENNVDVFCIHSSPPIFSHASKAGVLNTSI